MRLNRRLEAITGLSTASLHSEELQVIIRHGCVRINYSAGGLAGRTCGVIQEHQSRTKPSDAKIFALCPINLHRGFASHNHSFATKKASGTRGS